MPTHQLTHEEYEDLKEGRRLAQDEAAKLRGELTDLREASLVAGHTMAHDLIKVVRAAIKITQFAVANMPPEVTRHFPNDALLAVADGMHSLPDFKENERDLANEFRAFVRENEVHEQRRRNTSG